MYIRGETYKTGGKFVGVAPSGIIWVCYGDESEFAAMCETFDDKYDK